jgi:hypothetical protein
MPHYCLDYLLAMYCRYLEMKERHPEPKTQGQRAAVSRARNNFYKAAHECGYHDHQGLEKVLSYFEIRRKVE